MLNDLPYQLLYSGKRLWGQRLLSYHVLRVGSPDHSTLRARTSKGLHHSRNDHLGRHCIFDNLSGALQLHSQWYVLKISGALPCGLLTLRSFRSPECGPFPRFHLVHSLPERNR